ncbi:uncharacterized protein RHOBADRAFT_55751 [Rhodotorula graminis WP1]|uniref:SET domain-containing protein n=1 Tax=Rhodotorula graminis (strain WP1) TaxID=578459 RepID=A0A0P9GI69_RHOGW|nr:uncharacterized protein RHOBADRAFT_55751 [Rhodotorula graminis WP1]KPV72663.1 hypothetical protein RHOBADRAFT_55751 [Rhodotorula graminis WP1]
MASDWAQLKHKRLSKAPLASTSSSSTPPPPTSSARPDPPTAPAATTPPVAFSHPHLPSSLEVRILPGRGRGIVANAAFQPGHTLVTTAPLVSALDNLHYSSRCSSCYRAADDLDSALPPARRKLLQCSLCHAVQYCTAQCQKRDWPVHKHECAALRNAANATAGNKPVPDTPVRALGRLLWTSEVKGNDLWTQVESLESHRTRLSPEEQERFFHLSIALAQYVGQETLKRACPDAAAVLDLCSRFAANSFALTAPTDLSNLGVSISPLTALFNHSCAPNAVVVFPSFPSSPTSSRHMHVVALHPIQPGDEVVTSYVDLALPRDVRQKELRERYKFECGCEACEGGGEGQAVDPREALACSRAKEGCEGLIRLPDRDSTVTSVTCPTCRTTSSYKSVHAALDAAKLAFADADKAQYKEPHVAALHLQHLLTSLTAPLDSTPAFAPSAYPVLPALQLLLTLQLHASSFPAALSTARLALKGTQHLYARGHPVRALVRTTLVRLETMPPPQDAAHPDAETRYWSDVRAREGALEALVGALREVEVAFGDGGTGAVKGGEMAKMLRDLISDQEQGIVVGRRIRAAAVEEQRRVRTLQR